MLTHNSLTVKTHDMHVHSTQKKSAHISLSGLCLLHYRLHVSFSKTTRNNVLLYIPCSWPSLYVKAQVISLHFYALDYKQTIEFLQHLYVSTRLINLMKTITLLLFFMIPLSLPHETSLNLSVFTSFEPYLSINVKIEHLRNSCLWANRWLLLTIYWPCMSCRHGETSPRLSPFEKKW